MKQQQVNKIGWF